MTKIVEVIQETELLKVKPRNKADLEGWLTREIEDAFSSRARLESMWNECFAMYEALPRTEARNMPIENAPNIEVPIGMMASDIFYSTSLQTIFSVSPVVSINIAPGREDLAEHKKVFEDFVDWGVRNEFELRQAADHAILDTVQLGTGAYYIPWIVDRKKTKVQQIIGVKPRIHAWPIEDVIVQGGSTVNLQNMQFVGLRSYLTEHQVALGRDLFDWDISRVAQAASVGWVKNTRERLGKTSDRKAAGNIFEFIDCYCFYDIDGDGFEEDLLVTFDRTSHSAVRIRYNPYDKRPIVPMHYQKRAYLFYGMGILEKLKTLQREISDIHNYRNLNMLLANTRIWKAGANASVDEKTILWPGRILKLQNPDDFKGEQMADIYPSFPQAEVLSMSLARQLVGIDEMGGGKASSLLSSRTPATTAQIGLGQQNQRFAAAFDSMKSGSAEAVKHCMYRYQERLLADDPLVLEKLQKTFGPKNSQLIVQVLKDPDFDQAISLEMTATSDRNTHGARLQTMMQLAQIMDQYYTRILNLGTIATNPATPTPMRDMALKVSQGATELIERLIRTFDTIRDPKAFLVDFNQQLDDSVQIADVGTAGELLNVLGGLEGAPQEGQPQQPQQ